MRVEAGEAVGVIGANGAGKTTLLRVISGLLAPTAGAMTMQGVDLVATPPHKIIETGIPRQIPAAAGVRLHAVPAPEGAPPAAGRHHVGRRAADVRHCPRADERAEADP